VEEVSKAYQDPQPARTLMASSSLPSPGKGARCRNMVLTLGLSVADEATQEGFASFELMAECAPQFEIAIEILGQHVLFSTGQGAAIC
jgi:hypothetical protein